MRIKSLEMVLVTRIIRHKSCMIYAFFYFFCSKIIFDQNYFPTAEINLTPWGPLYTCLVHLVLNFFVQKSFLTKFFFYCWDKFTTRGPLYICLVLIIFLARKRKLFIEFQSCSTQFLGPEPLSPLNPHSN